METNLYAPPLANLHDSTSENEAIRREYLDTEGTIKITGWLLVILAFTGMWAVFSQVPKFHSPVELEILKLAGLFFLCLMQLVGGRVLTKLVPESGGFASVCIALSFLICREYRDESYHAILTE